MVLDRLTDRIFGVFCSYKSTSPLLKLDHANHESIYENKPACNFTRLSFWQLCTFRNDQLFRLSRSANGVCIAFAKHLLDEAYCHSGENYHVMYGHLDAISISKSVQPFDVGTT